MEVALSKTFMVEALEIVEVYVDHVGQQIKEIRERKGLPRTTVARFAGIHRNTLYLIEAGERTPSLGVLQRIANALEVSPQELFPKEEAPQEPGLKDVRLPEPDVFDLDEVSQEVLMVIGPASTEKVHDQIVELLVQRYTDAELSELYDLHRFWAEQEGDEAKTKALVTVNLALRALLKKRGGGV